MHSFILWSARLLFILLLAALIWLSLAGQGEPGSGWLDFIIWDKAKHFLAYLALCAVGMVAFPRMPLPVLFLALLAQSAIIEAAQPYFGRSRDIADLLANLAGLLTVPACLIAGEMRSRLTRAHEGDLILPAELVSRSMMDRK